MLPVHRLVAAHGLPAAAVAEEDRKNGWLYFIFAGYQGMVPGTFLKEIDDTYFILLL